MINDPITIEFNEKRQMWYLQQGNETFYNEDDVWIMYATEAEATRAWLKKVYKYCPECRNNLSLGHESGCTYG